MCEKCGIIYNGHGTYTYPNGAKTINSEAYFDEKTHQTLHVDGFKFKYDFGYGYGYDPNITRPQYIICEKCPSNPKRYWRCRTTPEEMLAHMKLHEYEEKRMIEVEYRVSSTDQDWNTSSFSRIHVIAPSWLPMNPIDLQINHYEDQQTIISKLLISEQAYKCRTYQTLLPYINYFDGALHRYHIAICMAFTIGMISEQSPISLVDINVIKMICHLSLHK